MAVCIYPGSFDPVTNGHITIIRRSLAIFSTVIVAVAVNSKKTPLFTAEERVELIRKAAAECLSPEEAKRVKADHFEGLLVEYARRKKARVIIRGLRAVSDFEYEFQIASMNRKLAPEVEMLFMMTDEASFYISSQTVKEVASLGGSVKDVVPKVVRDTLKRKYLMLKRGREQ